MQSTLGTTDILTILIFIGLCFSGFLLIFAVFMKISNGLFLARTIDQYQKDQHDPDYKNERKIGKQATVWIFKHILPVFLCFILLLILKLLNIID